MQSRNKSGHGLGDLPNGCKDNAFNGVLEVEIYMDKLEGFVQEGK